MILIDDLNNKEHFSDYIINYNPKNFPEIKYNFSFNKKKGSKFLIAKRNRNKHLGLKWEFPGGKVEDGESFIEALAREIKEELNIEIQVHKKIAKEKYRDAKKYHRKAS